jgi:hypothetical protein
MAHWSAVFGETEYLPLLVFPFVKLFQNNQLICFEVVATVLGKKLYSAEMSVSCCLSMKFENHFVYLCPVNWCQNWFEFFPNPPINLLSMVENLLVHHDRNLLQHLVQANVKSQVGAVCRHSRDILATFSRLGENF